jgi:hypothetical protein
MKSRKWEIKNWNLRTANGNAILEMIIFLPIAFLFGILALDAALAVTDKSTITDAIRSGLNDYKTSPVSIFQNGATNINPEFLNWTAQKIFTNITNARNDKDVLNTVKIKVSAVTIQIDSATGKQTGIQVEQEVAYGNLSDNKNTIYEALADYNKYSSISPFAVRKRGTSNNTNPYQDSSILIFAEATALTRGINNELRSFWTSSHNIQKYEHFIML